MTIPDTLDRDFLEHHSRLLAESFERVVGRPLINLTETSLPIGDTLYDAPFVVVSHGVEEDPILNYGNAIALELWEMSWAELTSTPSRLTAEPANQQARAEAMARVKATGFTEGYSAVRISKTGRRFQINNTVIWNVLSANNEYQGQAATFSDWTFL